ncbi:hypothetical protein B0H21DRAFT_787622 [Amylocystis lapponica]|nr:hypothetical protein B0H21DRAFT_787622 [Amylocystis lapponica]
MPVRRASAGHNVASSSSRVHRSNGSNHSISAQTSQSPSIQAHSLPYGSSGTLPATPQQKVVYVLVNRLKNKLPCNSGISLTEVENDDAVGQVIESLVELSRDSLDIIGWALSELLEKLAKQTDANGYKSVDVLQSQLFILKVLSIAMASRWGRRSEDTRPNSRNSKPPGTATSKPGTPDSPALTATQGRRRQQAMSDHLSSLVVEPPPLDDNCAKYILSVMVMCLRQTAPLKHRLMSAANMNFDASYHDFESVDTPEDTPVDAFLVGSAKLPNVSALPRTMTRAKHASSTSLNSGTPSSGSVGTSKHSLVYEKTLAVTSRSLMLLNTMISTFAGRIVYHLSASNWHIVLTRIRNKIYHLATTTDGDPDIIDLQLMTHSALDRVRLTQSLQELSSLLVNMKREAQAAVAIPLRAAIWNWIDLFPDEFAEIVRRVRRLDGAPERVYDILYELHDLKASKDKDKPNSGIWPTLAALMVISPDRHKFERTAQGAPKSTYSRKDRNFAELISWSLTVKSPFTDVGIICALDVCRAAFRLRPEEGPETTLQSMANNFVDVLKGKLSEWNGSKPFWECPDEIDVAMIADILVTLYRFKSAEVSVPLFALCLEPERSNAVKICALKAIMTLMVESLQIPWHPSLDALQAVVTDRIPVLFSCAAMRRHEIDQAGNVRRAQLRPKAKRYTSETLPDRDLVVVALLALTRQNPMWFFAHLDYAYQDLWVPGTIEQWHTPMDPALKVSLNRTFRRCVETVKSMRPDHPKYEIIGPWLSVVYPATLATVCTNLLDSRTDLEAQRMWINMAYELLFRYTQQAVYPIHAVQLSDARLPAFALAEISFLVSLTSAETNVALTAARCLRMLAQAETMPGAPVTAILPEEERVKRYPIYEQLGDPHIIAVGRVGMQKRVRKFMRLMTLHSPVHTAVWQECYWRWCALNEMTLRMSLESTTDGFDGGTTPVGERDLSLEERQAQWENLTLFMAAFGAAVARDIVDPSALTQTITPYYLPDQMRVLRDTSDLVHKFLTELISLLVSESVKAREVAKEALGSEMSPRLYSRIFKELDSVIRALTGGDNVDWESLAVFLDQLVAILKVLIDNVQNFEEVRGIDINATILVLASYIGRFQDSLSYRLRLKYCGLCDAVFSQAETITMRKDSVTRQKIVDIVIEWVVDPMTCDQDFQQAQRDLNIVAFRTLDTLFDRLQLQPPDGSTGEEAAHVVSRMFMRYMNFLVKAWGQSRALAAPHDDGTSEKSTHSYSHMRTIQWGGEIRELIIAGLAFLISANTECGVKHCLPLSYDTDASKRVLFSHVFTRVLAQGIKFNAQESQPVVNRQSRLCELIKGPDMMLALAICEVCPPVEVDNLISVLLNIFDTKSSLMTLLKMMIDLEVGRTDSDTSLFRGNSTCTRLLSSFASIYGYNYLRSIITPLIKTMASIPPGQGYDLDPTKVGEQEAKRNKQNVELVAASFLQIISSSISTIPSMFREICAHIAKVVNEVWPEAKFAAVGAFVFLRFISPAVVNPDTIDVEIPKDDAVIRRGLMIVAKIIQNLANNIFFGKEAHMIVLNDFLTVNIINVTRFLNELKKWSPAGPDEDPEEWLDTTYDDTDTIVLHRFFEKHADKVGKELLSLSKPASEKPTPEAEASAANGKRVWETLCAALVEMGAPLESARVSTQHSHDHREYMDMMARHDLKDTSVVHDLFVRANTPLKDVAVFVLSVSKIDVEILDIELLLYYIFKTLTSPPYEQQAFEIIFDFTSFTTTSQIPAQWLKFAHELIPLDLRERFQMSRILTPNDLAVKYLKRLYNLASGSVLSSKYTTHPTVADLLAQYPEGTSISALSYAAQLEREATIAFKEVTMRHTRPMRVPVLLKVANSHLRITTMKAQPICSTLSCRATEIIPLSDVNDVYNVSISQEPNEFIIRKIRHGVTLYFSSPSRDAIVKAIRGAKGNMQTIQLPGAVRFSRLSNVVTTLLHTGMLAMCSDDEELRNTGYELLSAVCTYLDYDKKPLLPSKIVFINGPPGPFLVQLSEGLATFAPQLTLDFITEVGTGMMKSSISEKTNCLQYLSPWFKNMGCFADPTSPHFEHSGSKFRDCIRVLIDYTLVEQELIYLVQKHIWSEVSKLDSHIVNIIFDELMRAAFDGGMGSARADRIADTLGAVPAITVRGRILTRLRKTIGKTSAKPTKNLADNVHWNEIACLCRAGLVVSYQHKSALHSQIWIPDTFHLALLCSGTGQTHVRTSLYGIIVNLLNSLYISRLGDPTASAEIHSLINECQQPETLRLFGLMRPSSTSDYYNLDPPNDKVYIDNLEALARFFVRILETIAGQSNGIINVWRARWMSLVTSSAFQLSPAVQTRAFIALGVLATSDVDDDLLYQMLVAFRMALFHSSENDTTSVVSMLRCIRNVVPALPRNSRYLCQLFWLAVALLQSSHIALYQEAIHLLRVSLEIMAEQGAFEEKGVSVTLLDGRAPLEDIACQLDQLLGLSFESNFSFSLASIIFKGVRHSGLRDSAEAALRSALSITVRNCKEDEHAEDGPGTPVCQEILGYFLALLPMSTTTRSYKQLLEESNVDASWLSDDVLVTITDDDPIPKIPFTLLGLADTTFVLFVASFVGAMLTTAQGDDIESLILYNLLSDIADAAPDIVSLVYDSLQDKVKDAFANASNPAVLSAVSNIFRVAMMDSERAMAARGSASTLSTVDDGTTHGPGRSHLYALEEQSMQGLANSFQFLPANRGHVTKVLNWISELVIKIIE